MSTIEQLIQQKAYSLGYDKCGIIPISELEEYGEKLEERIQKVSASEKFYQGQKRLADPLQGYPWAKSAVILVSRYGKYRMPEHLKGRIGKHYLFDTRIDENSEEFQSSLSMEKYLQELGLKTAGNRKFGLIGLRWAALKAGLGIIRRNNFFYTQSGSWVTLEAWLTDRDMKLVETPDLPPCPKNCNRCIKSCPTGSLSEPYTMQPTSCVSFLTTFGGRDLSHEPLSCNSKNCIYGCDICQDVCPMNKGKWEENLDFPGVSELAPFLTPEKILEMEDGFYKENIQPKFFYLNPDELWKWKVNVLNFMRNNYEENYKEYITSACQDSNEKVSEMARYICSELYG